eukprot:216219-Rhodomonas_salina.1
MMSPRGDDLIADHLSENSDAYIKPEHRFHSQASPYGDDDKENRENFVVHKSKVKKTTSALPKSSPQLLDHCDNCSLCIPSQPQTARTEYEDVPTYNMVRPFTWVVVAIGKQWTRFELYLCIRCSVSARVDACSSRCLQRPARTKEKLSRNPLGKPPAHPSAMENAPNAEIAEHALERPRGADAGIRREKPHSEASYGPTAAQHQEISTAQLLSRAYTNISRPSPLVPLLFACKLSPSFLLSALPPSHLLPAPSINPGSAGASAGFELAPALARCELAAPKEPQPRQQRRQPRRPEVTADRDAFKSARMHVLLVAFRQDAGILRTRMMFFASL